MFATEHEQERASGPPRKRRLSIRQVADRTGYTVGAVHNWIKNGVRKNGVIVRLQAEMLGGQYRIRRADLREFRRLCNPDTWKEAAEKQEAEKRQAKRDQDRLRDRLGNRKRGDK